MVTDLIPFIGIIFCVWHLNICNTAATTVSRKNCQPELFLRYWIILFKYTYANVVIILKRARRKSFLFYKIKLINYVIIFSWNVIVFSWNLSFIFCYLNFHVYNCAEIVTTGRPVTTLADAFFKSVYCTLYLRDLSGFRMMKIKTAK